MTILAATPAGSVPAGATRRYTVRIATEGARVRDAQALRHRVFAGELGAVLHTPEPGFDIDPFDADCDHLVILTDEDEVVGTYRMLPPGRASSCTPTASSTCAAWRRCGPAWSRPAARACTPTTAPAP